MELNGIYPRQTLTIMFKLLRTSALAIAALICGSAFAQPLPPYSLTITGIVVGCNSPGGFVTISTAAETFPEMIEQDVPLDPNCGWTVVWPMTSDIGGFVVSTPCNGAMVTSTNYYQVDFLGNATVTVSLDCDVILSCIACFTTTQSTGGGTLTPFTAELSNCTSGGTAPYAYTWLFYDGSVSSDPSPVITFPTPGEHITCLNVTDANGSLCSECDTVYIDQDGTILPSIPGCLACLEVVPATNGPSGPAIPWTVDLMNCSVGQAPITYAVNWGDGVTGQPGTHVYAVPGTYDVCLSMSAVFICEDLACTTVVIGADGTVNPITTDPCEAEFFVMQAYEWVDIPGNPNGGGGEPIPNELWVWNLSSGGTGNFQFTWSFGDGTSSTEAFPTHTYASGEYELCLTILDNAGCTDEFCDMVSVDGDGILNGLTGGTGNRNAFTIRVMDPLTTGVIEEPVFTDLTTWPNPVDNELNITLNSQLRGTARVTITDLSGRMVMDGNRMVNNGLNRMSVPVTDLNAGLYLVRIGNGAHTVSSRFVKVR